MDREYLEDYEQKENEEYDKLLKKIQEGKFSFEKDKFPPDERFIKLEKPVAVTTLEGANIRNIWSQIPFCGSMILFLSSFPQDVFEEKLFKISDIPKIVDFIKETGKLQVALKDRPILYEGLDYLDPFFKELKPPFYVGVPRSVFGSDKEIQKAEDSFFTLGRIRFLNHMRKETNAIASHAYQTILSKIVYSYVVLKVGHYAIVEEIENLMIDDPSRAFPLIDICLNLIVNPIADMRSDLHNLTLKTIKASQYLPNIYKPQKIRLPCEIGRFLMKKLTYAPEGLDACKELMYHYDAYDLRKVQESLNEAIVTNHPDIVNETAKELSEILDNVWNDKTIPRRVKGLQIGTPLSMAAIGSVAAGPIGAAGGFLAGLGYSVADKFIDLGTEGLSERLAKLKIKSYQANVYDFKEKYKHNIPKPSKESQTNA